MPFLLVDIGNSLTKYALANSQGITKIYYDSADIEAVAINRVLVCSVASSQQINDALNKVRQLLKKLGREDKIEHFKVCGNTQLVSRYSPRLGADRWAAALAAVYLCANEKSLLIINAGTATTIDWVYREEGSTTAHFLGGAIVPGYETMAQSLHRSTAKLPSLSFDQQTELVFPAQDTDEAIVSGVLSAQLGAIMLLYNKACQKNVCPLVVVSGGARKNFICHLKSTHIKNIKEVNEIVLWGLWYSLKISPSF